ncbi:MAG: alpha/beta hydrolase [Herpetosiphonaceae bacterium]|nr:alpha/beta hydrolase [Herpetosiphonaceae bacterium]
MTAATHTQTSDDRSNLVAGERRVAANGLSFQVVDRGAGPVVLLLHGWPDSSYLWRHQIPVLVDAGFRVIAPDLRGFGQSDRPAEVEDYALRNILGDIKGMLAALGVEHMSVVGHDWGAVVSWQLAMAFPDQVERLAALSVGYPGAARHEGLMQWQKRWYMLWFLFPGVAEVALPRDDWALFREFLQTGQGDLDHYIQDLSRPDALTASLNWYRANIKPESIGATGPAAFTPIRCPTMGIWSSNDFALSESQMLHSGEHVQGPWRYERIENIGHWIPVAAPDQLNSLLLDFLGNAS